MNKIIKKILIIPVFLTIFFLIISSVVPIAAAENLIINPSVETEFTNNKRPLKWFKDYWGENSRQFTYPISGQDGEKGVKIEISNYISGDAKWSFADVPVTGGQKYEFSNFYKSNINSYLVVRFKNRNGVFRYFDLATLEPANNWIQKTFQFDMPTNAVSATIYHLINNVGWLETDNYSFKLIENSQPTTNPEPTIIPTISPNPTTTLDPTITPEVTPTETPEPTPTGILPTETITPTVTLIPELTPTENPEPTPTNIIEPTPTVVLTPTDVVEPTPTETPAPTNTPIPTPSTSPDLGLVLNGTLEHVSSNPNLPLHWFIGNWGENSSTFSYPVSGYNDTKGAKVNITQITSGDAKWYFEDITVEAGGSYLFSDVYASDVNSRIVARFKLSDGTYSYLDIANLTPSANWKTTSNIINIPVNVLSLTVFHLIDSVGTLTIDEVSLTKQGGVSPLSTGLISLDFDDGWDSTFKNGLPILNTAGYKSSLYIITDYIGQPSYTTNQDILAAQSAGHEVGAHSKTHPQLPLLTTPQIEDEVNGSRQHLLNMGISPLKSFSYPYGEYNSEVISIVKSSGFSYARTALFEDGGFNDKNTDIYRLKTQSVENATTLTEIQGWIDSAINNKTWLILVMHQVDDSGSEYSITPQKLQSIVNYLKNKNATVVTVSQGVSYLKQ